MKHHLNIRFVSLLAIAIASGATAGCTKNVPAPQTASQPPSLVRAQPSASASAPPPAESPAQKVRFAEVTQENAERVLKQANKPVLVFICHKLKADCQKQEFILRDVAVEYQDRVTFAHIELSEPTTWAKELSESTVGNLPVHVLIKGKHILGISKGMLSADELKEALDKLIAYKPEEHLNDQPPVPGTTKI